MSGDFLVIASGWAQGGLCLDFLGTKIYSKHDQTLLSS
jgi:hypothetical protein